MKKNLKYISVFIAIFIVIVILVLILGRGNNKKNIIDDKSNNDVISKGNNSCVPLKKDNSYSIYYQMNENIKEYFQKINDGKNLELYYTIDEEYKENNKITKENILTKLSEYKGINDFQIYEIYENRETSAKVAYFIKCLLTNSEYVYFIYATDAMPIIEEYEDPRYVLYICTKEEYDNYISGREKYKDIYLENNGYNIGTLANYTDEDISRKYFLEFNNLISKNPEEAYKLLNTEYKNKKFPSYKSFVEYINQNNLTSSIKQIVSQDLRKNYATSQAVIKDKDQNMYIMNFDYKQYEIMLDDYTILSDNEKDEYNSLKKEEKVGKNVERFINMINDKDYYQAYSKLSDQFKETSFSTQEKFEEYIKENIFQGNDKFNMVLDKQEVEKNGEIYVAKVRLTAFAATLADNMGDKGMTIIMKLLEGEDFEMSFSM